MSDIIIEEAAQLITWWFGSIQISKYTDQPNLGGGGQRTGSPPEINPGVFCIHIQ